MSEPTNNGRPFADESVPGALPQPGELDQRTHERLCAYLLGDLELAERALLERELADSAALRAERERLAATLALVRGAGAGLDVLPGANRAVLEAALERKLAPRVWHREPGVRWTLAAGLAAAAFIGYRAWQHAGEAPRSTREELLALNSPPNAPRSNAGSARELVDSVERQRETLAEPAAAERAAAAPGQLPATTDEKAPLALGLLDALAKSSSDADAPAAKQGQLAPLAAPGAAPTAGGALGSASTPTPSSELLYVASDPALRVPPATEAGAVGDTTLRGSHTSRSAGRALDSSTLVAKTEATGATTYRGPGDSAPPGGAAAPAVPPLPLGATAPGAQAGYRFYTWSPAGANSSGTTAGVQQDRRIRSALDFSRDDAFAIGGADGALEQRLGLAFPSADQLLEQCRRLPNERPRDMFFRFWGDNPYVWSAQDRLSTFAVDTDTASYALARRYLEAGQLPPREAIRTEEFVNYFAPDLAAPSEATFALALELAPSRYPTADPCYPGAAAPERWLLRCALRAREVPKEERARLALTFVVDVSGSMREGQRLELVKHALRLLVGQLAPSDTLSLVVFSNEARVVLPPTSAGQRALFEAALFGLAADGGTNAEAGLKLGYAQAEAMLDPAAQNRVVLCSDGVANTGQTDQDRITQDVQGARARGVLLNTIGVGMNNHNDVFLEQLANKGNGVCNYVDSPAEAKKVFVDDLTGTLQTVALDAKIQVEFDPAVVLRYRQLGYENRALADADFRNDRIDAGEVGAGHQVSALYELELASHAPAEAALATLRVRYQQPNGNRSEASELARSIRMRDAAGAFEAASKGYRRAALVAQFAELLRRSVHARGDSLDQLIADAQKLEPELGDAEFAQFTGLLVRSRALILAGLPQPDELSQAVDALRRNACLRAELDGLKRAEDAALLAQLEEQNRKLEQQIRELLERRLGGLEKLGYGGEERR